MARPPPQDFVVGGGDAGIVQDISIDARSDALGGNASGTVSFRLVSPLVTYLPVAPWHVSPSTERTPSSALTKPSSDLEP